MPFVWSSIKKDPEIIAITSEMGVILEKTSGVTRKPETSMRLSVTAH